MRQFIVFFLLLIPIGVSSQISNFSLNTDSDNQISINIVADSKKPKNMTVEIISSGEVIKQYKSMTPLNVTHSIPAPNGKEYYRIELRGDKVSAITNPLFWDPTDDN